MNVKTTLFLIISVLGYIMCTSDQSKRPKDANLYCANYHIKGEFKKDSYSFCSIVPVETTYYYKDGFWKYWDLEGRLFAEGNYIYKVDTITGQGGCDYYIKNAYMDKQSWRFLNIKGDIIPSSDSLFKIIETCIITPSPNNQLFIDYQKSHKHLE